MTTVHSKLECISQASSPPPPEVVDTHFPDTDSPLPENPAVEVLVERAMKDPAIKSALVGLDDATHRMAELLVKDTVRAVLREPHLLEDPSSSAILAATAAAFDQEAAP